MVNAVFKLNFTEDYVFGDDGNFYSLPKIDAKGRKLSLKRVSVVQNTSSRGYWISVQENGKRKPAYYSLFALETKLVRIPPYPLIQESHDIPKDELPWNKKK